MNTIRQQIVDALVTRLKTLTTANGYASNAGSTVYSNFPSGLQLETLPALNVRDVSETIDGSGRSNVTHTLRLEVAGLISSGITTDKACRSLIGDIIECVMDPEDRTLGGVCDTIQPSDGGTIDIEQTTESTAGSVTISFTATYVTDRGDWSTKI